MSAVADKYIRVEFATDGLLVLITRKMGGRWLSPVSLMWMAYRACFIQSNKRSSIAKVFSSQYNNDMRAKYDGRPIEFGGEADQ